jgi:CheY-like chemotaxis protein
MSDIATWQVLLVDDEPDSLELISEVLTHEGATVYRAAGGSECLALLAELTPTLMVVDLQMPKPDGWDLLAHVRADKALGGVLVIATTAYHSVNVEQEALDAGFDAYIPKPLRTQMLIDTLTDLLA